MLTRMWTEGNPGTLLVAMQVGAVTMENSIEILLKAKSRAAI